MAAGDHIRVHRTGYWHHGIDMGDGTVIHFTGEEKNMNTAAITHTPLAVFSRESPYEIVEYASRPHPSEVIARALSRLGQRGYDLARNNCEHFATWCVLGEAASEQARRAVAAFSGTVGGGAAVAVGLGTVSAAGAVAGLSAPGIMSGLATVGGAVGGGAATGLTLLATAPVAVAAVTMRRALKDAEHLPQQEREARAAGRVATVAGGVVGIAAVVGTVSIAGVVGLSAVGITTGLKSIGRLVRGGMIAGVVIVLLVPALLAVASGYAVYKLRRGGRES